MIDVMLCVLSIEGLLAAWFARVKGFFWVEQMLMIVMIVCQLCVSE